MTMRTKSRLPRDLYMDLIRQFPLRPIRSDKELDEAVKRIDSLLDRRLGPGEQDYLDVLSELVERYESEAVPIGGVSDAAILRHLIEAKGVTQSEVAREAGIAVSTISDVLSSRRELTRQQIGKLAGYFHVQPGVFFFSNRQ